MSSASELSVSGGDGLSLRCLRRRRGRLAHLHAHEHVWPAELHAVAHVRSGNEAVADRAAMPIGDPPGPAAWTERVLVGHESFTSAYRS